MSGKIIILDREKKIHKLEAEKNLVLMEIIRDAGLPIEAACGGCAACATCHVYVDDKRLSKLKDADDEEQSMLDQTFNISSNSRLSSQIEYTDDLDGIELELAPE